MVDGPDLVRQHVPFICASHKFPQSFWPYSDDVLRGSIKYSIIDKYVDYLITLEN